MYNLVLAAALEACEQTMIWACGIEVPTPEESERIDAWYQFDTMQSALVDHWILTDRKS